MTEQGSNLNVSSPDGDTQTFKVTPKEDSAEAGASIDVDESTANVDESTETVDESTPKVDESPELKIKKADPSDLFSEEKLNQLRQELSENDWQFTEDHYKEFEKRGIPREFADGYLEGQKAKQQAVVGTVAKECGGVEKMQEALNWAANNLSESDIADINKQLASTNPNTVITVMQGLQSRAGVSTSKLASSTNGTNQASIFRDEAEFQAARRDPRFEKSPAYRQDVMRRAHASKDAGTIRF